MRVESTGLEGVYLLHNDVLADSRGYFFESFNQREFERLTGLAVNFVQDNQSGSSRGVLRGLHFQTGEAAQAKLVRVTHGLVLDVVADLRPGSATYGQHLAVELSGDNNKQIFIPRGFAHGFVVLSEFCHLLYKCDNYYNKSADSGIRYNDPSLGIDWRLPEQELIISEKDLALPYLTVAV